MNKRLARLRCKLRGSHDETCRIVLLPGANLQEHIHVCVQCETVSLAQLTKIDPEFDTLRAAVMGMTVEDQSKYLN